MRHLLWILPVVAFAGCKSPELDPGEPEPPAITGVPEAPEEDESWIAGLRSEPGFGDVAASFRATVDDGRTVARIELTDGAPETERSWHLHHGPCEAAEDGGIFHSADVYPPLRLDADGRAVAEATIPEPLDPAEIYHVDLHPDGGGSDTRIACGTLATGEELGLEHAPIEMDE